MLELLKELTGIECRENVKRKSMSARLCILEIFAFHGPCLSYAKLQEKYGRGMKGYLKRVLKYLEERGFIKKVKVEDKDLYCLTVKGLAVAQPDPSCPELFLAGADVALKVALESEIKGLNWLLSAGRYWVNDRFVYSEDFRIARSLGGLLFLDSGAQQFYSKFRSFSYPFTPRQYLDLASAIGADLVATLDLPLDILTPRGLSVREGIKKTVELGAEVVSHAEDMNILDKIVPVLQGYKDPNEWLEALDLYKQHGVSPKRFRLWGIGSLCMARSIKLVKNVIKAVRQALRNDNKIHVFGISMSSLRKVYSFIDSYDTSAWVYWVKMDGAVLVWSRRKKAFIHLSSREGHRYRTEDLMEANLRSLIDMHRDLCLLKMTKSFDSE